MGLRVDGNNSHRQELDKEMTREALEQIAADQVMRDAWSTVVFQNTWHKGVVGIVASRLVDQYFRPTVVLTESNGKAVGSARSVKGFDVYEAINACSDLLEQFGGHMYAAGLTMPLENVAFVLEAMGIPPKLVEGRANEVIDQVGLCRVKHLRQIREGLRKRKALG